MGERSQANRFDELEALYRREHVGLTRLATLLLGNASQAEEAVHEVFCRLVEGAHRPDNPGAYARRMVINACHSTHRRRAVEAKHRPRRPEPVEPDGGLALLQRLPDDQRIALALRYYLDLRVDDVAEAMGRNPGTVKSLLHRGKRRLREIIENESEDQRV